MTEKRILNRSISQGLLSLFGAGIALPLWGKFANGPLIFWTCVTLSLGLITLVFARLLRNKWDESKNRIVFLVNLIPLFVMLWLADEQIASLGKVWSPFEPQKLSVLALALISPELPIIGLGAIGAMTALSIIHYYIFSEPERALMIRGEPWAMVAYGSFACILLIYRLRAIKIDRQIQIEHARNEAMKKFLDSVISIQNLTNTPVQALIIQAQILKNKFPEASAVSSAMEISLERLKNLSDFLSKTVEENKKNAAG